MRDQISSSQNYTMYNVDIALCTKPHTVYSSHNLKVKHISIKTSALCFHSLFSRPGAVCTYSSFKFKFEIQILGVALLQVPGPTFQIQILGVALLLLHFTVAHLSYTTLLSFLPSLSESGAVWTYSSSLSKLL